jgi:hypothetical protein
MICGCASRGFSPALVVALPLVGIRRHDAHYSGRDELATCESRALFLERAWCCNVSPQRAPSCAARGHSTQPASHGCTRTPASGARPGARCANPPRAAGVIRAGGRTRCERSQPRRRGSTQLHERAAANLALALARATPHCVWLQAVAIAMALSTVVGLAAVMPFFAVLGDPTLIERDAALHWLQQRLGSVGEREFLVALGCGFIGLLLVGSIINLFGSLAMSRFAYRIGDCFRIALFNEYLNRDFLFHARSGAAQLSSNVLYQSDRVTGMLQSGFVLITSVVMIVFIVLSMAIVDPVVSLTVLLVFGAGYSLVYRIARRRLLDGGRVQTQAGTERVAAVEQGFAGIKDLLVTQGQPVFASRFAAACETISRAASSTQMIGQFPRYLLECIAGTGLIVAALLLSARGPVGHLACRADVHRVRRISAAAGHTAGVFFDRHAARASCGFRTHLRRPCGRARASASRAGDRPAVVWPTKYPRGTR